jgi:simple sugar transport system permease protein
MIVTTLRASLLCSLTFFACLTAARAADVAVATAASVLVYVMVNHVRAPGSMAIESAAFAPSAVLPSMQTALGWFGVDWVGSPLNLSFFLAIAASVGVYLFLWRSRSGYRLRVVGASPGAAQYAGIRVQRHVLVGMAMSGALAGLVGMNEISGVSGRLLLEFVSGAGFTGIGVALMGRNHPVGIVLASLLFGALFQGGAEVSFEVPGFGRDMVVMLQGFIVLFSGAMTYVIAPWLARGLAGLAWLAQRLQPAKDQERYRG